MYQRVPLLTYVSMVACLRWLHHHHDDVIKWKHFPRYWPKASDVELWCFLRPNKRLSKQSWGWWFETPSRLLWRHRNDSVSCLTWITGTWGFVSISNLQSMMCANDWVHNGLKLEFVCLDITHSYYLHYADLSDSTEHITVCQEYSVDCVSKIKPIPSIILFAIYRAVLAHLAFDGCGNICSLSYHHFQIKIMNHSL